MRPCPSDEDLARLLSGAEDPALREHLSACEACRPRWEGLEKAYAHPSPAGDLEARIGKAVAPFLVRPRRRFLPLAAAAALLLAVGLWQRGKGGAPPVQRIAGLPRSPVLAEWALGKTGQAVLAPGSRGRLERAGILLEEGGLWIESAGDPVRVSVSGWDGLLELEDGAALIRRATTRPSAWISEAWAGAGAEPVVLVARGKVSGPAGREWIPGSEVPSDPRGWRSLLNDPLLLRECVRDLGLPPGQAHWEAEMLVRKRDPSAEASLAFGSWEAPLGVHLPSEGWIRLRLEVGPERIRLGAGEREYFSCAPEQLGTKAYPSAGGAVLGLRVRGGEVEVKDVRWRP